MVSTGEVIPIDGVVHEGEAMIDQQAMTGEAILVEKHPGDRVMTATIVLNGRIFIVSEHSGEYNSLNQLNELLQQTQAYKTGLQLKGEAWADKAAFPVVAFSAIMTPFIGPARAFALLFSVPMNTVRSMLTMLTLTHMRKIHDDGILIKDGRVLEELIHIDTILFDKTGTLTQSLPEVSAVVSCGDFDPDTLLLFAAIAEQRLDHPIAQAIVCKAEESGLEIRAADDSRYDLGLGVAVTIDGHNVHVGSQRFIEQQTAADSLSPVVEGLMTDAAGHSFVLIAVDHRIEGVIELNPRLRPEVPALIQAMKQRGFRQLSIVSGDQLAPTRRLSEQLGMDRVYAAVRPHEKAEIVQRLQAEGRHVCFIGDGINDAIALKQANVSISLQSASTIAGEMAQVVMVRDTLESLDDLFATANGLHDRLGKSLKFWLGFGATNALAVPLLGFGPIQSSLYWAAAYTAGIFASSDRGLVAERIGDNRQASGSPANTSE